MNYESRLWKAVSALHMVKYIHAKQGMFLIPHGSLQWDENGETHSFSSTSQIRNVSEFWNLEWQNLTLLCTSKGDIQWIAKVYTYGDLVFKIQKDNSRSNAVILSTVLCVGLTNILPGVVELEDEFPHGKKYISCIITQKK